MAFFSLLFVCIHDVCVLGSTCAMVHVWRSAVESFFRILWCCNLGCRDHSGISTMLLLLLLLLYREGVGENDNTYVSWAFCGSPLLVLSVTSVWVLGSNSGCQACKHLYPLSTVLAPILLFLYGENTQLLFSCFFEI